MGKKAAAMLLQLLRGLLWLVIAALVFLQLVDVIAINSTTAEINPGRWMVIGLGATLRLIVAVSCYALSVWLGRVAHRLSVK